MTLKKPFNQNTEWLQDALHLRHGVWPIFKKAIRREFQGWKMELLTTISVPLSFFLAFGLGLRDYIQQVDGVPYVVFLAPGLITYTMLMEAYRSGGWGMWLDRWHQKTLSEYRMKPISTADIIIGEMTGGFTVAFLKGLMVALVLLLLCPVPVVTSHLPKYLAYLLPGCMMFTAFSTLVGVYFRKPDQIAQVQTIFLTPLLYLGGMFFPVSEFPAWLKPIITWLPTTALFQGGREALLFGTLNAHYLMIVWTMALVSFMVTVWLFERLLAE